jgi:uncharacterized protein YuzE
MMAPIISRLDHSVPSRHAARRRLRVSSDRHAIKEIAMKVKLDKDDDALYFRLQSGAIIESEEVRPGVILDFDENDRVIGVEFLRVSERASSEDLAVLQFEHD